MKQFHRYNLVLAAVVTSRGLAYVLFEGEANPIDWGRHRAFGAMRNHRHIERFINLIEYYKPDLVVLQDPAGLERRSSPRALRLVRAFSAHAEGHEIPFVTRSRRDVLTTFAHLSPCNKHTIARAIIAMIPVFEQHTPRRRMPWMQEDSRMGLFDAAALAISWFAEQNARQRDEAA